MTTSDHQSAQGAERPVARERLIGLMLTAAGAAGIVAGVLFATAAPGMRPVPVVFLGFWLAMVLVGKVFFTGLTRLRQAGYSAPAPEQIRAAAAVVGIVSAVSFAGAFLGAGSSWATCPGDATCPPAPPTLTFTPPPATGGAQPTTGGQQTGSNDQGIATSPSQGGGNNGDGIQAQTPQGATPGQQAPDIPGNEPDQTGSQGTAGARATGQQPPRTTAPGRPNTQRPSETTRPTVTVTKTQSECPLPGAGTPAGAPGASLSDLSGGGTGDDGPPSWAYLVNEATALTAGRRLRSTGSGVTPGKITSEQLTQTFRMRSDTARLTQFSGDSVVNSGQAVAKPVSSPLRGTPTTGLGLPNPDWRTAFRPDLQGNQRPTYNRMRGSLPRTTTTTNARAQWDATYGQRPTNPWYLDGRPNVSGTAIDADHLIPIRTLAAYPGFSHLSPKAQNNIAEMPENIWGVPSEINQKLKDKPKTEWDKLPDGTPLNPEMTKEAIRLAGLADEAIRKQIVQELLNDRDALRSLLRDMGYSEEEINTIMNLPRDALQKFLEEVIGGERPTVIPGIDPEGDGVVPKPSKHVPGDGDQYPGFLPIDGPTTPDHWIHASDVLPDGWEPPAALSKARDAAWQGLLAAYQQSGTQVTTPALEQAWHTWSRVNGAYMEQVQMHWNNSLGRSGPAPDVPMLCTPARMRVS